MSDIHEVFGKPIFSYSRAQAIEDGLLVDLSTATDDKGSVLVKEIGFKFPIAMTRAAYAAAVQIGGHYQRVNEFEEVLELPPSQSVPGRIWDVLWMLLHTIRTSASAARLRFVVRVDIHGDGHLVQLVLYSVCGPGDQGEPVITIMLDGED